LRSLRGIAICARAEEYLRAGMPIGEIAYALGYSDPTVFRRAFRRWFGQSPSRWRSQAA
jgi:AraC-like DNA-binding protein